MLPCIMHSSKVYNIQRASSTGSDPCRGFGLQTVAYRAHEAQAAIEGNVKGLKKEASQQLRELQVYSPLYHRRWHGLEIANSC